MIRSLQLQNFEGYKDSSFEFDPNVNVIIGPSDAGKSSIIRVLNLVRINRPLGDGFRRKKKGGELTKQTDIIIQTGEWAKITRRKSNSKNQYIIDNDPPLESFSGQHPPDEVVTLLALDDINIQGQYSGHFLLDISPGEAARTLNKAASISKIDSTISNLNSKLTKARRTVADKREKLKELEMELEQYKDIDIVGNMLDELERILNQRQILIKRKRELYSLITEIENVEKSIIPLENKVKEVSGLTEKIIEIDSLIQKQKGIIERRAILISIISSIRKTENGIGQYQSRLNEMEDKYHELMPDECPLCGQEVK